MQGIAGCRKEQALPTTSEERRAGLEELIEEFGDYIQRYKQQRARLDEELAKAMAALQQLGEYTCT